MSELLLKYNKLDAFQKQEVLDFINFLLTKERQKMQATSVQEKETEEPYDFFESAGLMENHDIDANQLRRDGLKL